MPKIPERLKRRGRPVDPEFSPTEDLYRRVVRPDHIGSDGFVTTAGVPFPDLSVNRGKYSEPEDVLLGHGNAVAIAAAKVGDIPREIEQHGFLPVHDPEPDNYSHTEIRTYRDGVHLRQKPSTTVRKEFRLSFRLKVLRRV